MYVADRERILHAPGVLLATIVDVHLKYGKYLEKLPGQATAAVIPQRLRVTSQVGGFTLFV